LRALAVTTATRSPALPDVPALAEFLPGYEATGWQGICSPKKTSQEIVDRLNTEVNAALTDADLGKQLADSFVSPLVGSAADFGNLIAQETEKWRKVMKLSAIKPDDRGHT
jgi:tripartite-type tricarboxylate transporter receptor subunit TctC